MTPPNTGETRPSPERVREIAADTRRNLLRIRAERRERPADQPREEATG